MKPAPPPEPGRLLVVAPRLPAAKEDPALTHFLTELAAARTLDLLAAGPSSADEAFLRALRARGGLPTALVAPDLAARARAAVAARDYEALVVIDAPATRVVVEDLRRFSRKPLVLAMLGPGAGARPSAPLSGDGFGARRAERRAAALQACAATQVWDLAAAPRPTAAALDERLRALGAARPARALTSVVIPCYNGLRYTRECLAALARHTPVPYEVIVVDNASTDGTAQFAREQPRARVIRNAENLGFGKAINQGMRAARGRYVVWLNNDVVVTPRWLERMIDCAERAPWIGAVGPCTDDTVGFQRVPAPPFAFSDARSVDLFAQAWALQNEGDARGVQRLVGFCLLLKREAMERVGLLDERFGIGTYEDYDYSLRLRQAGYDLVVARDVFVRHHGHKTFQSFAAMEERSRVNREIFLDKWCGQSLAFLDDLDPEAALVNAPLKTARRPRRA